jgi:hypothetical protein
VLSKLCFFPTLSILCMVLSCIASTFLADKGSKCVEGTIDMFGGIRLKVFTATQFSSAGCVTNLAHVSIGYHCNTACRCSNYCSTSALERIVEFTIHTSTRRPQNLYLMLTYYPLDWKKFLK